MLELLREMREGKSPPLPEATADTLHEAYAALLVPHDLHVGQLVTHKPQLDMRGEVEWGQPFLVVDLAVNALGLNQTMVRCLDRCADGTCRLVLIDQRTLAPWSPPVS